MGFFDGLVKMAQGKPIFEEPKTKSNNGSVQTDQYRDERGSKIYPELTVERSECYPKGDQMTIYAHIKNASEFPLVLDRVRFMGRDERMPSDLSVGEVMSFKIYSGSRPRDTRNGSLELIYCNQARDYFSALYYAEFKKEIDGTYGIHQFKRQRGVKDIYE